MGVADKLLNKIDSVGNSNFVGFAEIRRNVIFGFALVRYLGRVFKTQSFKMVR